MNGAAAGNARTATYKELLGRLPEEVRELADATFRRFLEDPSHRALSHHALKDTDKGRHRAGGFSVSVTMRYRAIYVRDGDTDVWYWIGSHADYDTFTGAK